MTKKGNKREKKKVKNDYNEGIIKWRIKTLFSSKLCSPPGPSRFGLDKAYDTINDANVASSRKKSDKNISNNSNNNNNNNNNDNNEHNRSNKDNATSPSPSQTLKKLCSYLEI